ncbi:3-alpha,7-alpha,12-alpha-trihydroxy-5-beta-choles t-24-enoyl-CoA hydratase [Mycolicibacterium litorale]|uniref:3-alpha,7-alpha,12-alpha-trihydroxy-5-beta-choles t-24-enoyl-CoA hydratase n=1 Tax=Mycolicibacterium litorale TaxID=758802 RepID=A0A6S6P5X0_9MYCO|nr:MaoC/PaaZ C-terminal domain-containing protein [Mycolicibacterium litorale]BCI53021.1 3-alpha,7-alpha,12-alpha-trihydroxy-5-beta-choles t-24-enoyl-CoA hydratase [Mycolicibacterium litorale]
MTGLDDLVGHDLGRRVVTYSEKDAILYALCVGADPADLPLVYERDLHVLPTFGLGLGLWAVEAAGALGRYDRLRSLHAKQSLVVRGPLPPAGALEMHGRITAVWDKGTAAMIEITVESDHLEATYSIYAPGAGGWGGERGPATPRVEPSPPTYGDEVTIAPDLPALYRLTGDLHPVHIDPEVARQYGFDRPILHGLCTLGIAARMVAGWVEARPWELTALQARFAAPVQPGDQMTVTARPADGGTEFEAHTDGTTVLSGGLARF